MGVEEDLDAGGGNDVTAERGDATVALAPTATAAAIVWLDEPAVPTSSPPVTICFAVSIAWIAMMDAPGGRIGEFAVVDCAENGPNWTVNRFGPGAQPCDRA